MVERLNEILNELESEKVVLEASSDEEVIEQMVLEYKTKLTAEFSAKKERNIADKEVEISVIKRYLEKEKLIEAERAALELANSFRSEEICAESTTEEIAEGGVVPFAEISI